MAKSQIALVALFVAILMVVSGCASYKAPFEPPHGILFGSTKAPIQTEMGKGGAQVADTYGMSSSYYVREPFFTWLSFAWDECSVEEAAQEGNLASVSYADCEYFHVLGIFCKMTVKAYGPKKTSQ